MFEKQYEKNGVRVDVHDVRFGEVYFQIWPAGVMRQGFWENLHRMPVEEFMRQVSA